MDSIYHFNATLIDGQPYSFKQLQGRVVLIVNTASSCNFTHQYGALERVYQDYQHQGLVILGFPCNQFGRHESADNATIKDFCESTFNVSFPLFSKVMVNGPDAHPLFNYLKEHTRGIAQNRAIKWNFTKFLINSQGQLVNRYAPRTKPDTLRSVIESQLDEISPIQLAKV
ncbi:glutathione peroxidase [Pseudoalteromonas sp. BDTF-M6]|uniref:glutathione peroxidase n=1 Tax=Pseudoalteromonas sp. BDTF-M6 TaxID=2796132 RepID=UPI001BAFFAA5|nr:glutathione peroxidase [Pseudoalteromonas sp. BDTF-M6]MBS3796873.1 glutathione peroxidase [Pseudoalteromonas sp. BDTF-M6]